MTVEVTENGSGGPGVGAHRQRERRRGGEVSRGRGDKGGDAPSSALAFRPELKGFLITLIVRGGDAGL